MHKKVGGMVGSGTDGSGMGVGWGMGYGECEPRIEGIVKMKKVGGRGLFGVGESGWMSIKKFL